MTKTTRTVIAGVGALALLAPAGALAKKADAPGGKAKPRTYVFKGSVTSVSPAAADVTVRIEKGNAAARRFAGADLTFDLATAELVVADVDGDGAVTTSDVRQGDRVIVKLRAPRDVAAGAPLSARQLVDLTSPPVDEDEAAAPTTA